MGEVGEETTVKDITKRISRLEKKEEQRKKILQ